MGIETARDVAGVRSYPAEATWADDSTVSFAASAAQIVVASASAVAGCTVETGWHHPESFVEGTVAPDAESTWEELEVEETGLPAGPVAVDPVVAAAAAVGAAWPSAAACTNVAAAAGSFGPVGWQAVADLKRDQSAASFAAAATADEMIAADAVELFWTLSLQPSTEDWILKSASPVKRKKKKKLSKFAVLSIDYLSPVIRFCKNREFSFAAWTVGLSKKSSEWSKKKRS